MRCRTRVAVCVPVRDERQRLPGLIGALCEQVPDTPAFALCIVFDGHDHASESFLRSAAAWAPFRIVTTTIERLPTPNAGRARRAAMALGQRILAGRRDGYLLSTDADTIPERDWVRANSQTLQRVDVVAGHIRWRGGAMLRQRRRLERYLQRLHGLQRCIDPISYDPAPSHCCQGGASLGFTASAYAGLGGFAACCSDEDVGIVTAARHAGLRVAHDRAVRVATSARRRGRASGGLAAELAATGRADYRPQAQEPTQAAALYSRRAQARSAFAAIDRPAVRGWLARALNIKTNVVQAAAARAPSADAFSLLMVPMPDNPPRIPLADAEQKLAALEARYGCRAP